MGQDTPTALSAAGAQPAGDEPPHVSFGNTQSEQGHPAWLRGGHPKAKVGAIGGAQVGQVAGSVRSP